jgi:pimeloyl-ACP methyl ester carboxylesterase
MNLPAAPAACHRSPPQPRRFRAGLAFACLALALAAGCSSERDPEEPAPSSRLDFGPCAVATDDPAVLCGALTVAEDRHDPASRLIKLPFMVWRALSPTPQRDAVLVLTGGPGGSPLQELTMFAGPLLRQHPWRQQRDLVVLNYRGTELTQPGNLNCTELETPPDSRAALVDAVHACSERVLRSGARPAAYDSAAIALDLRDLRLLLSRARGYEGWNIVASSYGTRLALRALHDEPRHLRSVVLDGPVPPEMRLLESATVLDAVDAIVRACEAQTACRAAYPNLAPRFAQAVERLEHVPAAWQGGTIDGRGVLKALLGALFWGDQAHAAVPRFMDAVARGDLQAAHGLLPLEQSSPWAAAPFGLLYSVACQEPAANALPPEGQGWPDQLRRIAAAGGALPEVLVCPLWPVAQAAQGEPVLPRTSVPLLLTVGQFDPATPARGAEALQRRLPGSRLLTFAGRGHGLMASDLCAIQAAADFVDNPASLLHAPCADRPAPDFLLP